MTRTISILSVCLLVVLGGCKTSQPKTFYTVEGNEWVKGEGQCPSFKHQGTYSVEVPVSWHNCEGIVSESRTDKYLRMSSITGASNWQHGKPSGEITVISMQNGEEVLRCTWNEEKGVWQGWRVCKDQRSEAKTFYIDGKPATPAQLKEIALRDYRKQCAEIGFTPNTDKFADCVLRLMEMKSNSKPKTQTVIQNNSSGDPAVRALLEEQKRQRELDGALELMKRGNEMMQSPKPALTCTYNPVLRRTTCN